MENRSHALIAGIFTVLLTLCIAVAALWLNRDTVERTPYLLVTTGSVAGLNPQAAVRYRGMEVGKVESIDFDRDKPGQILVKVGVLPSTPVTTATFAELGMQGLTGLAYVQLDVDEKVKDAKLIPSSAASPARLRIRPSMFDRFSVSGEDLMVRASTAMDQFNKLLDDDKQKLLIETLKNLQGVSAKIGQLADEVQPAAQGVAALTGAGRKTLSNADDMLVATARLANDLNRRLDVVDRMARSVEQVARSAEQMALATAAVEAHTLPRLNTLLDDADRGARAFDGGMRNFDRAAERLADEPTSILFGPQPGRAGPGEPGFVAPAGGAK